MILTDKFGGTIEIGDDVIFAKFGRSAVGLYTGNVRSCFSGYDGGAVINITDHSTGKLNVRKCIQCVLLKPYKDANPEYFV